MSFSIGIDGTPLLGPRSGVGNYTGRLLAAMLAASPEGRFLLFSNRPLEPLEAALSRAERIISRTPSKRLFWMQCLLPQAIRRSQAQLCHFPNAMAPIWQQKPFVLTIHDASLYLYASYHPLARLISIRLALPILVRRASAIITVSYHARNDLVRILNLPPQKVHVVYEAAPEAFRPIVDGSVLQHLANKYGLPEKFMLFVGTLEPRKNLRRLVRVVQQLQRAGFPHKLVVVGANGWHAQQLYEEIERLNMGQEIIFTGYVPTADLPGLFTLATLFVYPSLYEGFGLPPVEAMACGTPVLTSDRGSLPEVCADAAYYVDPEREESIFAGVSQLLADEALRRDLAHKGRDLVRNYSWRRAADETLHVYRRVLS